MAASSIETRSRRTAAIPRGPTSLSSWGLAIAKALEARGCDAAAIFTCAELDFSVLDDPEARMPVRNPSRLWPLAVQATGDPCFGLEVARHTTPTTFHALGFSLAASTSLREAFERAVRYYRLVSDAVVIRFEAIGETYRVSVETDPGPPAAGAPASAATPQFDAACPACEVIDAIFALAMRFCRSLTDRDFSPLLIEMRRRAPADPTRFHKCFRAPIRFGADRNAMTLDKATCDKRLRGANPGLARANDLIAAQAIQRWDQSQIVNRVRLILLDRLPTGASSPLKTARVLGTSTRALQRRLAGEGTSYTELVNVTRRELASAYLLERQHSITDIACLLGFSRVASFTRAFRRWYGRAPSEFRHSVHQEARSPTTVSASRGYIRYGALQRTNTPPAFGILN